MSQRTADREKTPAILKKQHERLQHLECGLQILQYKPEKMLEHDFWALVDTVFIGYEMAAARNDMTVHNIHYLCRGNGPLLEKLKNAKKHVIAMLAEGVTQQTLRHVNEALCSPKSSITARGARNVWKNIGIAVQSAQMSQNITQKAVPTAPPKKNDWAKLGEEIDGEIIDLPTADKYKGGDDEEKEQKDGEGDRGDERNDGDAPADEAQAKGQGK